MMILLKWLIDLVLIFCLLWYVESVWDAWEEYREEDDYKDTGFIYARDFFCFFFLYGFYWLVSRFNKN